jgi:inhibitor of cysteine peptidase
MAERRLTATDSGATVTLRSGDSLFVDLPEILGTGYQWVEDTVDAQILDPLGSATHRWEGARVGGGGTRTFSYRAKGPGTAELRLKRWRWRDDDPAIQRFAIVVTVDR